MLSYGFDDVLKRPLFWPHFELELLRKHQSLQSALRKSAFTAFNYNRISEMSFSAIDYFYRPKPRYLQRRCAYIEPQDLLKYLALTVSIADVIEKNRIQRSKNIVHSYRFNGTGKDLFSPHFDFSTFRKTSKKLSSKKKFSRKIITDISGFYDRINIHRIESQLLSIGCNKESVSKLNNLLLTWNNRDSYGLPVGNNASRILAEAALIDIDRYLIAQDVTYVRFVDDFRIFASDVDEAAYLIQLLQARLAEDGLTLNSEKTHIVPTEHPEDATDTNVATPVVDEANGEKTEQDRLLFYKEKIPLSYRPPSDRVLESLRNLDVSAAIAELEKDFSADVGRVKDVIRAIVIQNKAKAHVELLKTLKRYVEIVPYAVDMMVESRDIESEIIHQVSLDFEKWLFDSKKKPDYVITSILRLLIQHHKNGKSVVARYLEQLPRHGSSIIGREIFLSLMPIQDRGEVLQMRGFYKRATQPEKRAIIKGFIQNTSVHPREKEAWLKTIRSTNSDLFIDRMIGAAFKEPDHVPKRKKGKKGQNS
jgi:hypothetical protein